MCRFINADDVDVLGVQDDLYDKNLYAYCDNNPVSRVDQEGDIWEFDLIKNGNRLVTLTPHCGVICLSRTSSSHQT